MLISEKTLVVLNSKNIKYFKNLGYVCGNIGDSISVYVKDLFPYSRATVIIKCDFCGKTFETSFNAYNHRNNKNYDSCKDCSSKKIRKIFNDKYGVDNPSQLDFVKEKSIKTSMEKFGCPHPSSSEYVKNKVKETNIRKYGFPCALLNDEVKNKRLKTNLLKYGTAYPIETSTVRSKIEKSFNEKYGVINPSQIPEIKRKILNRKFLNGNQTASKQQLALHDAIGGELNYPFMSYYIDIAFPYENIAVEYIGGGHDLSVKLGTITKQEFIRNENYRRNNIFNGGWKLIEFISLKNKTIQKDKAIELFNFCKNLFNSGKHYIIIDIDNGVVKNRNGEIYCNITLND